MNWLKEQAQRNSAGPADRRSKDPTRPSPASMPPRRTWLTFLVILLINYLLVTFFFPSPDAPVTVPYNSSRSR